MTQRSPAANDAARRLWADRAGDASAPGEVASAADRVCGQLRAGLTRWVGSEGYRALLDRALGLAEPDHPALRSLRCHEGDGWPAAEAARSYSAAQVSAAMVALVATLIDLLGRIIGEEMAVHLVEQTATPVPRGGGSPERQGALDG